MGPYIRQFDGKWIQILSESDHDQIMATSEHNDQIREIQFNDNNYLLYLNMYESRNQNHGVFGFPDSEVYSDSLDHLQDSGMDF